MPPARVIIAGIVWVVLGVTLCVVGLWLTIPTLTVDQCLGLVAFLLGVWMIGVVLVAVTTARRRLR